MTGMDEMRAVLRDNASDLMHPATSEVSDSAFGRVMAALDGPGSYMVALSWFAAAGAASLQATRDAALPPSLAKHALFMPQIEFAANGEPRTPSQVAAMQIVTAHANEDLDMAFALASPYALLDVRTEQEAGALLGEMAILGRVMHRAVCDGGH